MTRIQQCGLVVLLHSAFFILHCSAQIINTVAGSTWNFNAHFSSGSPATNAPLGFVSGVAVDSSGNLFAADSGNHIVVKVSRDGTLTVIVGSEGFSGIGPSGVAVDAAGNVYVADRIARIRKVSPEGTISTVAGNGQIGFSGDGGPATAAALNQPFGVAVDSAGNLYIATPFNNRIRKVSASGIIATVAGNGTAGFSGDGGPATSASLAFPQGLALDLAGNLYIADTNNGRIRKVTAAGTISTVAGGGSTFLGDGGPATATSLNSPGGVAVDTVGNLYIPESAGARVRKVTPGGTISTVAGTDVRSFSGDGGPATSASLFEPGAVAVDTTGNLYIADTNNYRIRKVNPGGTISTIAGNGFFKFSGDGGPATAASLYQPFGVAGDTAGNLYISDAWNNRIRKVATAGTISTVAGTGISGFSGDGGPANSAELAFPLGVAVDAAGNLYIGDADNRRIRKVTAAGTISTVAGGGSAFPGDGGPATSADLGGASSLAVDTAGNLFVAQSNRIRKVTAGGTISTVAGNGQPGFSGDGGLATSAQLNGPWGVAVDAAGNLYIADINNARIRKVSAAGGIITTVAGNGVPGFSGDCGPATSASLHSPFGVAADAAGNLYIADAANNRIRKVSPSGIITTVAGSGNFGFSGDAGPATSASLAYPQGVALDAAGNLYIADSGNDRIRKIVFPPPSPAASPTLPPDSAVNAASFRRATDPNGGVAPGANVAVFGTSLAANTQVALSTPLPTALLDTCLTFTAGNGTLTAPLFFVSGGQINAQVPFELPPGAASVQVRRGEQVSAAQSVKVAAVSPGIFSLNQQGTGAGAILHADSFQVVSESNPARPGEFVILFGTGLGAVQPSVPSGQPAPSSAPLATTVSAPVVNIGGIPATVVFSGLAPGFVGLYQVNVQVPTEIPPGTQPVQIIINGVPSNTVTVAVSQ